MRRIISTFAARLLVALLNLCLLLFTARWLGSEILGQVSLIILNISLVQILNEIYTGASLVHFIPRLDLKKVYTAGLVWTLLSVILVNLCFLAFNIGNSNFAMHTAILSFLLILHSFHMVLLLAREKIRLYNTLYVFQASTLLLVLVYLVYAWGEKSVWTYLRALYAAYGLSLVLSSLAVIRLLGQSKGGRGFRLRPLLAKGISNQLGNLAHTLSNRFNYYVIGTSAWLGVYASSTSLVESIWLISGSAAPIVLSHVANRQEEEQNPRMVLHIARICFAISLACVVILYCIPQAWFVWMLGKDFSETKSLMLYLSPGVLAISFSTLISHYFSGLGQQRMQLLANSCGLLCTVLLSSFLIRSYGLKGACITASLAYSTQALVLLILFMRKQTFSVKDLFIKRLV